MIRIQRIHALAWKRRIHLSLKRDGKNAIVGAFDVIARNAPKIVICDLKALLKWGNRLRPQPGNYFDPD